MYCLLAVTSGEGKTTTAIGCGSAGGHFVFAEKRFHYVLDAIPGSAWIMSETGWSNGVVFQINSRIIFSSLSLGVMVATFLCKHLVLWPIL